MASPQQLFTLPYIMPDATVRNPLIDRVPALRPKGGGWQLDVDHPGLWEMEGVAISLIVKWLAARSAGGIGIKRLANGDWAIRDVDAASNVVADTYPQVLALAAHTLADQLGLGL